MKFLSISQNLTILASYCIRRDRVARMFDVLRKMKKGEKSSDFSERVENKLCEGGQNLHLFKGGLHLPYIKKNINSLGIVIPVQQGKNHGYRFPQEIYWHFAARPGG